MFVHESEGHHKNGQKEGNMKELQNHSQKQQPLQQKQQKHHQHLQPSPENMYYVPAVSTHNSRLQIPCRYHMRGICRYKSRCWSGIRQRTPPPRRAWCCKGCRNYSGEWNFCLSDWKKKWRIRRRSGVRWKRRRRSHYVE